MRRSCDRPEFRFPLRDRRFAFIVVFLAVFSLLVFATFVNAETPKPKRQEWQLNGIVAALDDDYPEVKQKAFEKLFYFETADLQALLQSLPQQSKQIEKRAIDFVNNSNENSMVRMSAANALGYMGKTNDRVVQVATEFLNNRKENVLVRRFAAYALGYGGTTNDTAVRNLIDFLKNSDPTLRVDSTDVVARENAADALGYSGKANNQVVQVLSELPTLTFGTV